MLLVATLDTIITIIGVYLIYWTLFHTRRAADGAIQAAEAMPVIERAYLVVDPDLPVGLFTLLFDVLAQVKRYGISDNPDRPSDDKGEIRFIITNIGKTPGVLNFISARLGIFSADAALEGVEQGTVLRANEHTADRFEERMLVGLTPNQVNGMLLGTERFCFWGTIEYTDMWGTGCTTEFEFEYSPEAKKFIGTKMQMTAAKKKA